MTSTVRDVPDPGQHRGLRSIPGLRTQPSLVPDGEQHRLPVRDGLWIGVCSFALFLVLGQSTMYRDDGLHVLQALADGRFHSDRHHLALPVFSVFVDSMAWFGLSPMRALTVLSALGCALGLLWSHRGMSLLGLSRYQAIAACAMVAASPAILFFATVVEYHGAFFCFSQLAFWAAVRFAARPDLGRALIFGVSLVVAWSMHSSGVLLGICFGTMAFTWPGIAKEREVRSRVVLGLLVLVAFVQVAGAGLIWFVLDDLGLLQLERLAGRAQFLIGAFDWLALRSPEIAWREWLVAHLPLSLAFLIVVVQRGVRVAWFGIATGIAVLCLLGALLLSLPERGAYLLPMAAPMAVLVARSVSMRTGWALAMVGLLLGVAGVRRHDVRAPTYHGLATGLRQMSDARDGILLTLAVDEWSAVLLERVEINVWHLFDDVLLPVDAFRQHLDLFDDLVEARRPAGGEVWISTETLRLLDSGRTETATLLVGALRASYHFQPVSAAGFTGFRLVRKAP